MSRLLKVNVSEVFIKGVTRETVGFEMCIVLRVWVREKIIVGIDLIHMKSHFNPYSAVELATLFVRL